ncbi:MAG: primosomal protein N' [Dehalococcoidia bacterium]|nr:MAG: primosomal protein N' [Dehalococcoidia bacterium]
MKYAEVAVHYPLTQQRTFSYTIPPDTPLNVGNAVWVPFGPRLVQGIVLAVSDNPSVEETREIAGVIEPQPILLSHQVELCRWIAEYYLSSYFEAAALMLPPGFERRVVTYVELTSASSEHAISSLTASQQNLITLLEKKRKASFKELKKAGIARIEAVIEQLVRKGLAVKSTELERVKVKPRIEKCLRLTVAVTDAGEIARSLETKGATRQAELLRLLMHVPGPIPLSKIRKKSGLTSSTVQTVLRKGLISAEEIRVQRDPLAHRSFKSSVPPVLTPAQEEAWAQIRAEMEQSAVAESLHPMSPIVFMLHGVTGSGKTEIYLRALDQAILTGNRAIVLVPEIALTPQTIDRFAARFPNRVAIIHSRLSMGEQYDVWHRIREGAYDVVIGSRGALFAPQPNLGLIVLDEEHEWTYKQQEQQPRYHARDVAIKLSELTGAVVILGSATPDVTSYYKAQKGEFRLLRLPERVSNGGASQLPEVEIVDLRRELKEGNRSIFSRKLAEYITETLAAHEQVILFLNRRGTATFVQCRNCGLVLRCRRCDTSLTYHTAEEGLVCHHCNYRSDVPVICPSCQSRRIKFLGIGTQRVEEEVVKMFPGARTLRWDRDVTRGKHSHERIMDRFLAHEADILIGTQMIAKGLDMPLVSLVGVINADIGLYLPDFRASERTFQILAQVAGRAGRRKYRGKVIIQSYTPEHYAIAATSKHDYSSFYKEEIAFRYEQGDPPFSRLARLVYTHTNAMICRKEAERVYDLLEQGKDFSGLPDIALFGPTPAFTQRIRGRFRWQIVVRSRDPLRLLSQLNLPQGWSIDIDPVNLL